MTHEAKQQLLAEIKKANSTIRVKERKTVYEEVQEFMSKGTFTTITCGYFVSDANVPHAELILQKFKAINEAKAQAI